MAHRSLLALIITAPCVACAGSWGEGEVSQTQLVRGTRYDEFHEAGARVISAAIFAPPVHSGCRLPYWTRFDVAFTVQR